MPHELNLVTTIAAALGLALVMGFIAVRLKLPPFVELPVRHPGRGAHAQR